MDYTVGWVRTLRTIVIAGLLVLALVSAVLGLIGAAGPHWMWASDDDVRSALPPRLLSISVPG